jgi:beta-glucanase (GH16 family)
VAAILPRIPGAHYGHGFLYGRVSIRMRADYMPGYKLAILLWPDSEVWPRDGEIDFPEADLNGYLDGYMHRQGALSGNDSNGFWTHVSPTSWHTVTVVWLRHSVTFLIDGHSIGRSYTRVPSTPMHLVIQAETSTTGSPPSSSTSGDVQLNWVAISTPACNPGMSISPAVAACAG